MRLFGRKKKKEEEEEKEENQDKKAPRKSTPRQKKIKTWGKYERILVFGVFGVMALVSAILAASARSWKLPNLPKINLPNFSLEETIEIKSERRTPAPTARSFNRLRGQITTLTGSLSGIYAVYTQNLTNSQSFGANEKEIMQAASLIKLPVMVAVYQEAENGNLDLDATYSLKEEDKVGGSGSLSGRAAGTKITYRQMLELMGKQSDNTAFNIARKKLGDTKIQKIIDSLGMADTSLADNETTAADIGGFFKKLWDGRLITKAHTQELLQNITDTIYEDWIPASLPEEDIRVAHKYGREIHVINDAGIIYTKEPFILVIMTQGIVEKEAADTITAIVEAVYQEQIKN